MFFHQAVRRENRQGAALVEMAACLPVFLLIAFGTLESCRMLYVRQSLRIAAYEGSRLAITPDVSQREVEDLVTNILSSRRIQSHQVRLSAAPESLDYEDLLTVTVSAEASPNAVVGGWFYQGSVLEEAITIMAEQEL